MRRTIPSESIFARALALCVSIAAFTLLAPTASAQFQVHPPRGGAGIGGDPESPDSDKFGTAVAIRSGLAFISAPSLPTGSAVIVYTATPTALIPTGIELRPSNAAPFESFGLGLAYRDGVLLVASDLAVYVFQRNSSGVWTQRQKFPFPPTAMRYEDGTLALGASGAVNIYQRDAAGKFTLRQKLVSPDSAPDDRLGDVGMAGPTMVIGGKGKAYVFRRNSTGVWRYRQTLIASELGTEEAARAGFGSVVAIDRGMIIVGAPGLNRIEEDKTFAEGAAYGFILDGSSYVETFKLQPRLDGYGDPSFWFGQQIAMFGDRIVVGSYSFVPLGGAAECDFFEGAFFSYTRAGSSVLPRGVAFSSGARHSMALADQRLLVGTPCIDSGFPTPGRATLFLLNVFR
jgi:hypothetical protein